MAWKAHVRYRTDDAPEVADSATQGRPETAVGPPCRPAMGEYFEKANTMLYTVALILVILWVLGLVSSYTLGGFIHVLLVVALIMILVNVISGRRS